MIANQHFCLASFTAILSFEDLVEALALRGGQLGFHGYSCRIFESVCAERIDLVLQINLLFGVPSHARDGLVILVRTQAPVSDDLHPWVLVRCL